MKSETLGVIGYLTLAAYVALLGLSYAVMFRTIFASSTPSTTPSYPSYLSLSQSLLTLPAIAAGILVSTAWYFAGRKSGNTVFKITGIVGYVQLISVLLPLAVFRVVPIVGAQGQQSIQSLLPAIMTELVVSSIAGILGLVSFVLQIVSFFSAAKVLGSRYFRFAGFGLIASVVVAVFGVIVAVGVMMVNEIPYLPTSGQVTNSTLPTQVLNSIDVTLSTVIGLIVIPFAISFVLAAWGFDNARESVITPIAPAVPMASNP